MSTQPEANNVTNQLKIRKPLFHEVITRISGTNAVMDVIKQFWDTPDHGNITISPVRSYVTIVDENGARNEHELSYLSIDTDALFETIRALETFAPRVPSDAKTYTLDFYDGMAVYVLSPAASGGPTLTVRKKILDQEDLILHEMSFKDGGINMKVGGEPAMRFMEALVAFFEENGGENFLTLTVANQEKKYAITIENCHGKDSPAQKLSRMEGMLTGLVQACNEDGTPTEAFQEHFNRAKAFLSELSK